MPSNEQDAAYRLSEILLDATDRRRPRLSRRKAARLWGINESTFQKWITEPGRIPDRDQLLKLATGLDMPLKSLLQALGYEEPPDVQRENEALIGRAIAALTDGDFQLLSRLEPDQKRELMQIARRLFPDPDETAPGGPA